MGAVAGEVLADRDLQAAEAAEDDADPDRRRDLADQADRQASRCRRGRSARPAGRSPRAPAGARRSWPSCSTAASRPDNGHPEETFTRHHPISMPSRPKRGRECQPPQPGSPTSWRETRTHLNLAGSASICRSSSRLRVSSRVRSSSARRASPIRVASSSRTRSSSPRPRTRGSPQRPSTPQSISTRQKASAKRLASSRSRRPIWRRSSARARRSSAPTPSPARVSRVEQIRHRTRLESKSPAGRLRKRGWR